MTKKIDLMRIPQIEEKLRGGTICNLVKIEIDCERHWCHSCPLRIPNRELAKIQKRIDMLDLVLPED